jgi:thymidylate kinase
MVFNTQKVFFDPASGNSKPIINISDYNWAIFTGTTGPNNKLIVFEAEKNKGSFYKISHTQKGTSLIKNEVNTINKLLQIQPSSFTFPKTRQVTNNILSVEDLSHSKTKRTGEFSVKHLRVFNEIYQKTKRTSIINILPVFEETNQKLIQLETLKGARIPQGLISKLRVLFDSFDQKIIDVAFSHGDFTPWNLYVDNEKLAIYDWEMADSKIPIGFDAFHFIIQQGALVEKKCWKEIKKEIDDKITPEVFAQWSGATDRYPEDYLKLYLIINTVSYLDLYSKQENWHEQIYWLLSVWSEATSDSLKQIKSNRSLLISDVFDVLLHKDYAAINFPDITPGELSEFSDIDLCLSKDEVPKMVGFLKNHPLCKKIQFNHKSFMTTAQIFLKDGSSLSLDLIWKFKRKSLVILNAAQIRAASIQNIFGIKQMAPEDVAVYLGLFYTLNSAKIPQRYQHFVEHLPKRKTRISEILQAEFKDNHVLKASLVAYLKQQKENQYINRIINSFQYFLDSLRVVVFSKGLVITFSGVDGAGKSTVIEKVKIDIEKKLRKRVVVLRHRPSVLPILSAWTKGKKKAEQDAANTLPRQGKNQGKMNSLFRFTYYYSDYLFGQFHIYLKYILRGYVVLYDRYYFDFINDGKRSNIQLPKKIILAGYSLLLKPDLNFFLYAPADIILGRKQELDKETIISLTYDYLQLFQKLSNSSSKVYLGIENIDLDNTIDLIIKQTIAKGA